MILFSKSQASLDQIEIALRRCDALLRLLLKRVQNIDHISEPYRIHGTICVGLKVVDDFQNRCAAKSG
jgi:hypothetical protein